MLVVPGTRTVHFQAATQSWSHCWSHCWGLGRPEMLWKEAATWLPGGIYRQEGTLGEGARGPGANEDLLIGEPTVTFRPCQDGWQSSAARALWGG